MMPSDRIDRLPVLLDELAQPRVPDYFDDLLGLTARTRQRPAWAFIQRWLPMLEIARQPVVAQPPWRAFGLLLLLMGVVGRPAPGCTRPKPPPPFGPAGNGLVVMARDGDIFTVDTRTGAATAIVTGPEIDADPVWSQDGTTMLFRRASADRPAQLPDERPRKWVRPQAAHPGADDRPDSFESVIDLCAEAQLRAVP